ACAVGSVEPRIALRRSATISSPSVTTAPTGTSPAVPASTASSSARRIGGGKGKLMRPSGYRSGARLSAESQLLGVVGDRCRLVLRRLDFDARHFDRGVL